MAGRSDAELDALVGQATVDAYDEDEQPASFHVVIEEHLAVPFRTTVLGVEVTVTKIDLLSGSGLVAICSRGKHDARASNWPATPLRRARAVTK